MELALKLHPDSHCAAVTRIQVEIGRPGPHVLELRYRVTGNTDALLLRAPAAPVRTDELWRHTCLEAFVRAPDTEGYDEFNLSPSTRWAAYRFTGYRSGMSDLIGIASPRIEVSSDDQGFELRAWLELESSLGAGQLRLGLSAVIEQVGGDTSYWALAHPPGKPDFHHADCFALEVQAPEQP